MINIWRTLKKPILALAPMAGYTDSAFRLLCLKNGAAVVYTEMISAEALARENKKTLKMLEFLPGEKNVIVQLFGHEPTSFRKALKVINKKILKVYPPKSNRNEDHLWLKGRRRINGLDLNFGCPAHKVYRTGAGAALMDNKKLAREIIKTVLENTNLPVSIKIRSRVKKVSALEFVKFIQDLPVAAVMIHGRSLSSSFSGPIDYEAIKQVKQLLPDKIVLANGGINSPEDARKMLEKTGADGLGLARGALGRPWIFKQIKDLLALSDPDVTSGESKGPEAGRDSTVNWKFIKKQMLAHAHLFLKHNPNLVPLRKHLIHYVKGLKNASDLRQKIIRVKGLEHINLLN